MIPVYKSKFSVPRVGVEKKFFMTFDLEAKKILLRKIPHGLFICGVREDEEVNGFTASWVTQGSFDPPLVVMAVKADGSSHGMIQRTKKFSLNVLRSDQKELAAVFFKPQKALGGRFESAPFNYGEMGLPILEDAIGGIECEIIGQVGNTIILYRFNAKLEKHNYKLPGC